MRHDFDFLSLFLGLGFVAIAIAAFNGWLVDLLVNPDLWSVEVVVATVLIGLGVAIGAAVATILRRRRDRIGDGPPAAWPSAPSTAVGDHDPPGDRAEGIDA